MSLDKLISLMSRLFFLGAFALFVLAVIERIANTAGYTILRLYSGGRLLEFAAVLLIFVVAIQQKEIKEQLKSKTLGS